jgi:hypothetical protein
MIQLAGEERNPLFKRRKEENGQAQPQFYGTSYLFASFALIGQPYSGHESRTSLEIYSRLSLSDAQETYEQVMKRFPLQEQRNIYSTHLSLMPATLPLVTAYVAPPQEI